MRLIKPSKLEEFSLVHPDAREALGRWKSLAEVAMWKSLVDIRAVFRSADEVMTASGRSAVVFNIRGNKYRLIVAVHYNRGWIFVMRFLTHAEYSKDFWKRSL